MKKWSGERKAGDDNDPEELSGIALKGADEEIWQMRRMSEEKETKENKWWGQDDNWDRKVEVFLSSLSLLSFVILYHSGSSNRWRIFLLLP